MKTVLDIEIAGATQTVYRAHPSFEFDDGWGDREAVQRLGESLRDVWTRKYSLFLREFVNNPSVIVRQRIIPHLPLRDEECYPKELRPLVGRAIEIARNHPDSYIRHRFEVKMGDGTKPVRFSPLPAMDDSEPQAASLETTQKQDPRTMDGLRSRLKSLLNRWRHRSG